MDSVLLDVNYSLRRLFKTPGFSILAILTLALAIGANTTVFSMLNALILRPLPVLHPRELVFLSGAKSRPRVSRITGISVTAQKLSRG